MFNKKKSEEQEPLGPSPIKVLISEEEIKQRIRKMGEEISRDYRGKELVVIGILKGAVIFLADLVREIKLPLTIDFLRVSSYDGGRTSSGVVKFELDVSQPITGKDVLVVEDVVDTGLTISYLIENLKTRKPKSFKICSLLYKQGNLKASVHVDYVGFSIPSEFVVGYGLDFVGQYRNVSYIATMENTAGDKA